jgi:succinate dehydrogenase flavin-adding protein (antitoxin of CptAB toxin-antitoxin module)
VRTLPLNDLNKYLIPVQLMANSYKDNAELQNDPFESVTRLRTRYENIGETPPDPKVSHSLTETLLKVANYPGNLVRGLLLEGTTGLKKAATGEQEYSIGDKLKEAGVGKVGSFVGGLIGDVLLDPTTYIGAGAVKNLGAKMFTSGVVRKSAEELAGNAFKKTAEELGTTPGSVAEALTNFTRTPVSPNNNPIELAQNLLHKDNPTAFDLQNYANISKAHVAQKEAELTEAKRSFNIRASKFGLKELDATDKNAFLSDLSAKKFTQPNEVLASSEKSIDTVVNSLKDYLQVDELSPSHRITIMEMYTKRPEQLNAALNIAKDYGTKIKDFDTISNIAEKITSTRKRDINLVDNLVKANERLLGIQRAYDHATVRAKFANNLIVDINSVGKKRFAGIVVPFTKIAVPLVDVTTVYDKANKIGNLMYKHVPGYKLLSDWFRKAISGKLSREFEMAGGEAYAQAQKAVETIKTLDRFKLILPKFIDDFLVNAAGHEGLNADERVRIGATYLQELGILRKIGLDEAEREIRDPYSVYIWANIADDARITPEELSSAVEFIKNDTGEEGLQRLQDVIIKPFLAKNGNKLTPEEVQFAEKLADKIRFATDAMFDFEKMRGIMDDDDYISAYVKHMYEYLDEEAKRKFSISAMRKGEQQAQASTAPYAKPMNPREFKSLGEAIAKDNRILRPIDDILYLAASRLTDTLRVSINKGIVEGIDELMRDADLEKIFQQYKVKFTQEELDATEKALTSLDEDVLPEVIKEQNKARLQAINATLKVIKEALGGMEGLKALTEVVKPAKYIHPSQLGKDSMWVPIDEVFDLTPNITNGGKAKYYIHKDLKPYLDLLKKPFTNSTALNEFLQFTDSATRFIKKLQTTYNPAFIPRNVIGEAVLSTANGTTLKDIADAYEILKNIYGKAELDGKQVYVREALNKFDVMEPTDLVTLNGEKMTVENARQKLLGENIINLGEGYDEYAQNLYLTAAKYGLVLSGHTAEYKDIEKLAKKFSGENALGKAKMAWEENKGLKKLAVYGAVAEHFADKSDALFRLADFIHNIRVGMSEADAAARVKMFHVDYQDLTQAERLLFRRIVPYYTFMRKNIPIQLRLMVERPGYYSTIGTLLNNSYAALGNPATPDYLHKNLALPIYEDEETGYVTYLNWNLPLADLSKFRLSPQETMQEMYQMLHPGIRAISDLAAGRNLAFNTPIDGLPGVLNYFGSQLGGASTVAKAISEMATPDATFEGTYAPPRQIPGISSLFPVKNPRKEELARAYRYREELLADMKKRKDEGKPIPPLGTGKKIYENNYYYYKNKDWVQKHNDRFTP